MKYLITNANMPRLCWITLNRCKLSAYYCTLVPNLSWPTWLLPQSNREDSAPHSYICPFGLPPPYRRGSRSVKPSGSCRPQHKQHSHTIWEKRKNKEGHQLGGAAVKSWQKQRWIDRRSEVPLSWWARKKCVFQNIILKSTCIYENSRKLATQTAGAEKPK